MEFNFTNNIQEAMDYLCKQGAFLTTKADNQTNTMTISWGSIGFMWNKPIFTLLVRKSRFSHDLIEKSNEFTISIPLNDDMKKQLGTCGSTSGRNIDKFQECNLNILDPKVVSTPVIYGCNIYYECKVICKQEMNPALVSPEVKLQSYANDDFHTIYYGEIVAAY